MTDVTFFVDSEASEVLTDAGIDFTRHSSGWKDGDTETLKFTAEVDDEIIDSLCLDTLCDEVGIPSDCLIHLAF